MKMRISLLLITVLLSSNTCEKENEDCHESISFENNTEKSIYILWDTNYPDTMYFGNGPSPEAEPANLILPNETSSNSIQERSCWEAIIAGDRILSDTLMIFVFDGYTIENTEWSEVVHEYLVLQRFNLSLEDLESLNWTITYP